MKKYFSFLIAAILVMLMPVFSGCSVIEGIFKAGVWTGILIVVVIIALIIFLISRSKK